MRVITCDYLEVEIPITEMHIGIGTRMILFIIKKNLKNNI